MYASDMQVVTADRSSYSYPDVMVTCEPRQDKARFKSAPCLLVEVLSKSTAHTDHFAKYHAYERTAGGWLKREYRGTDVILLPFLDAELPLDEIYQDVWPA